MNDRDRANWREAAPCLDLPTRPRGVAVMTTLPFSPLTLAELNARERDVNETIAHMARIAHRRGLPLDGWDLGHMAAAAEAANAYADAAFQRVGAFR